MLWDRCLSVLSCMSCLQRWCTVAKRFDGSRWNFAISLVPGHIVLDGDSAPLPQRDTTTQFSAHICCGQMVVWIKMPLGIEPRRICVRWGPSSPPQKGGGVPSPIFGLCPLWPNCWMDQYGTWHGGGPWCRPNFARWGPSKLPKRGHIYCCQTAGCIKVPLDMVVGLCQATLR